MCGVGGLYPIPRKDTLSDGHLKLATLERGDSAVSNGGADCSKNPIGWRSAVQSILQTGILKSDRQPYFADV